MLCYSKMQPSVVQTSAAAYTALLHLELLCAMQQILASCWLGHYEN